MTTLTDTADQAMARLGVLAEQIAGKKGEVDALMQERDELFRHLREVAPDIPLIRIGRAAGVTDVAVLAALKKRAKQAEG